MFNSMILLIFKGVILLLSRGPASWDDGSQNAKCHISWVPPLQGSFKFDVNGSTMANQEQQIFVKLCSILPVKFGGIFGLQALAYSYESPSFPRSDTKGSEYEVTDSTTRREISTKTIPTCLIVTNIQNGLSLSFFLILRWVSGTVHVGQLTHLGINPWVAT